MSVTSSHVAALPQLHIDTSYPAPSTASVAVVGEVDLATASVLRDRLLDVLREQAPAVLIVDLGGVTFLDCTGVGALAGVRNTAIDGGRRMWIVRPQPIVRRVLDLTGLLGVLTAPIDQPRPANVEYPSGPATAGSAVGVPVGVLAVA
jgi:anti-anti-sigma factor